MRLLPASAWARFAALVLTASAAIAVACIGVSSARAGTVPANFQDSVVFSGLSEPTAVRFSSDGRIFVAEKRGVIKVFDNLQDTTPTVFADLNVNVYNAWDRGVLGLALAPNFPTEPSVYVMYTYDGDIGGPAPRWGTSGQYSDPCPSPPGFTNDGCVVSGRISRLTASGNVATGPEQVLVHDWCQQYPSHSIGSLQFGADGALYATGGDGASFNFADWGQDGSPRNPCGDPPGGVGAALSPPTAEGGALRAQDVRTTADPTSLNGTVIRIDPNTGAGMPDNPFASSTDANARRIIAYGLRNPFRFTIRPGTTDVWVGDVGWDTWEEVDHLGSVNDNVADNFGWPCYEGANPQPGYDGANLNLCETLYSAGGVRGPVLTYNHSAKVVPGESCLTGSSSISGMAFYDGGTYPSSYVGALFFADYSRKCIWAMFPGSNGQPNPSNVITFDAGAAGPVDLQIGPGGDLFYADFDNGTIRRVRYMASNNAPVARVTANPTSGSAPLAVQFDASTSNDSDAGDTLSYSWDLDGDGTYGDSTVVNPSRTYSAGTYTVTARVSDNHGASDTASVVINANGSPPVPTIDLPTAGATWKVGDTISFSGHATDAQDGALPASALSWTVTIQHCPSNCHTHPLQSFAGVDSGSFAAIDHEYPSYLELTLTAQDSSGQTASVTRRLDPQTVDITFASAPSGLQLVVGPSTGTTPFTRTVIVGSNNSISATSPQVANGRRYTFAAWSDDGPATHNIVAGAAPATYTAMFDDAGPASTPGLVAAYSFDQAGGTSAADASGSGNTGTLTNGAVFSPSGGKYGGAVSFDGQNDSVTVADSASLDLTSGMTLEAWVRPSALGTTWRTAIFKQRSSNGLSYALYANRNTQRPDARIYSSGAARLVDGTAVLPLNAWTHLAATFDGSALRLYLNGTQDAQRSYTGTITTSNNALTIGGNAARAEWFEGFIDDVRIYNRALTAAEVASDMNRSVGVMDTTPPSAPQNLAGNGSTSSASLSWGPATDDVGIDHYNLHRSNSPGFTPSAANRIAQPTALSYTDTGLALGFYYYKVTAQDAAGNIGPASNELTVFVAGDTQAPSDPSNFAKTGSTATSIATSWTASQDNVGVAGYRLFRDGAQQDTTTGTTYTFTGLACGSAHTLGVEAYDLAGNTSARVTLDASTGACDTTPPTVAITAPLRGATVSNTVSVTGCPSDTDAVAGVQFRLDGTNLGAEDTTSPYSVSWDTRSVANGAHTLTAVARDGSGNIATSANVAVTVTNSAQPPGLVAAYSFDQAGGTSAPDASGSGNTGTLTNGAVFSPSGGKYGGAVSFDAQHDSVTVADSASLDLTSGMTLEAWVRPATTGWPYRTVLLKEQSGNLVYALYLTDATRPLTTAITGGIERIAQGPTALTANTWVHLASTYDGVNMRLYVNGTLVRTTAATGPITVSSGALRIGSNSIWTEEAFAGLVDEVRVYNRALTAAEVTSDMNVPVGPAP